MYLADEELRKIIEALRRYARSIEAETDKAMLDAAADAPEALGAEVRELRWKAID